MSDTTLWAMQRVALIFLGVCSMATLAQAGAEPHSGKNEEMLEPAPPSCERYNAQEWDFSIWGAYAFPGSTGTSSFKFPADFLDGTRFEDASGVFDVGRLSNDRFLDTRHAWGGGADLKCFWTRYIGIGLEGFILDARNTAGGVLSTVTVRYPIGCSRLAPYFFAGVGAALGGSDRKQFLVQDETANTAFFEERAIHKNARAMGQFGGGLEFRVSRHMGLMIDFTWNVVDEPNNNFGLARAGLTFPF